METSIKESNNIITISLIYNSQHIGKVQFTSDGEIITIYIHEKYRGNNYLIRFFPKIKEILFQYNSQYFLYTLEDYERYGKLQKLYEKCGFIVDDTYKEKLEYRGEYMYREIKMILKK